jgi:hypothetical protein
MSYKQVIMKKLFAIIITLLIIFLIGCVEKGPAPFVEIDPKGVDCEDCHGKQFIDVTSIGGHSFHVDNPTSEACKDCHPNNTKELHTKIDSITLMKDGKLFQNSNACDDCHGTGRDRVKTFWNEPQGEWLNDWGDIYCRNCHDGSSVVHGRKAPHTTLYFDTTGHGNLDSAGYSLNCELCHDPNGAGHTDGIPGDSRMAFNNDTSAVCLDCHDLDTATGIFEITAEKRVTKHSTHVTNNYDYNHECVECHNPHGNLNIKMVRDSIDGGLGAGYIQVSYKVGNDLDPTISPDDGVCDVCHAVNEAPHPNTTHPGHHNQLSPIVCTTCHKHYNSFVNGREAK